MAAAQTQSRKECKVFVLERVKGEVGYHGDGWRDPGMQVGIYTRVKDERTGVSDRVCVVQHG